MVWIDIYEHDIVGGTGGLSSLFTLIEGLIIITPCVGTLL